MYRLAGHRYTYSCTLFDESLFGIWHITRFLLVYVRSSFSNVKVRISWYRNLLYVLGPDRGVCLCRKCQCKPKYHGDNCDKKNCTFFPPETQCKKDTDSVSITSLYLVTWLLCSSWDMARDSNMKALLYRLNRKSVEVLTEARVNQM